MAREEVVDDARLDAALVMLLLALLVAGVVPAALRIDLAAEGDPAAVGREDARVRAAAQRGDRVGVAAV